jgi:hypothetical protein
VIEYEGRRRGGLGQDAKQKQIGGLLSGVPP